MDKKTSLVIVEDHPVMRGGLAAWFAETGRWELRGTASGLAEAKALFLNPGFRADIVLLDIQLADGWGLDLIPWLREQSAAGLFPEPAAAVYSAFDDYAHVHAAAGLGVRAYVCKKRGETELEAALAAVLDGGTWIDPSAQTRVQNVTNMINLLTRREAEILTLVKKGLSNKQIAAALEISRRTVENILSCVYDKTGIRSRRELERL